MLISKCVPWFMTELYSIDIILQVQLNEWYESLLENPSGVRSLADLIAFNDANPELEEPTNFTDQSEYVFLCPQYTTVYIL